MNQPGPLVLAMIAIADEPKSIAEAEQREDKASWWKSVMEEIGSWEALKVYKLVDEDELKHCDVEIIDSKVVFKLKLDEYNNPFRYKCRIVARGFQESDAGDTFAQMAHPITIRTLISIAVAKGWSIRQGNVKTAYLHAQLPKPIYLRPPRGLEKLLGSGKLLELRKAVYGLGASGRLWWQTFTDKNKELGMESITPDDCVFRLTTKDGSVLIIVIVVDDVLIIGNSNELRNKWFAFMNKSFEVTDDCDLKYYLGVHYTRDANGDLIASQSGYLERVLARFGMTKCKHAISLMQQKFSIDPDNLPAEGSAEDVELMRQILGSLMYLQVWTRPEISYAVNYLARYTLRADKSTITAARRILRYLAATQSEGIRFKCNPRCELGEHAVKVFACLLYTSDAADDMQCVDLG
eukprot:2036860-Rhodomonas_salina.2